MPWALQAQTLLAEEWGVDADVWSVTSWNELRRDAIESEQQAMSDPGAELRQPYVTTALTDARGPVVAVSDYMRAVPDQISRWVPNDYTSLGTDGFGFADTRGAARRYFHIDAQSIVVAVLAQLARRGEIKATAARVAAERYQLNDVNAAGHGTLGGDS
jgi:pyruvate dehydrogenase E1 component